MSTRQNGRKVLRPNNERPPAPRLAQPLLIVAFGGSGRKIATQFKAILIESFGAVPENVIILAFDSANDPISERECRQGRVVELEQESEFFLLNRVPLAGIKRSPHRHPEIVERLGDSLNRIHRSSIHDGAAQERPQGLLSMMWNVPRIEPVLSNAVRHLVERNEDLRHDIETATGINVVLVGSTCGGQNSGSMPDAAFLVREKLVELGDLAESSRVVAMVVLPGAFHGLRGPNLLPNTHAFFLELDLLMQGTGFEAHYPGNIHIRSGERPFDHVFVLDGVDERGKVWPNWEEVCALGARALAVLFSTEVGIREIFNAVNERGVLQGVSADGCGTYLATVGQAVIRFPARQVAERCALRQALAMIDTCLLAPARDGEQDALPALMGADTLRERLRGNADGAPFQVRLVAPAGMEQSSPEEIPAQARTLSHNYLQRRIYGDYFAQIKETATGLESTLANELAARLERPLADGHLLLVMDWLRRMQDELQRQYAGVVAELESLAEAVEQSRKAVESAGAAMDQAAGSLWPWRRSQMRHALDLFLKEATEMARLCLEQRGTEATADLLRTALQSVQQRLLEAEAVLGRLRQAREHLAALELEAARAVGGHNEINLADEELVERLYRQYAGNPQTDVQGAIARVGGLLTWAQQTPDQLADHLAQAAGHAFAPLLHISVEDVLAQRWDDRSAQQWVARLENLAAGAWNLDLALLPGGGAGLASFLTLGVPDAAHTIFANSGCTLTGTHDPERIVALRTVYGVPFDALKPAILWKQAYDQAVGRTPLHVLPQFRRKDDSSVHAFTLGVIFGCIYNQVTWFYYKPADPLEPPQRLGQGLENALSNFGERTELQRQVIERVEGLIARNGTAWALELIEGYVNAGSDKDDDVTKMLRRAARDYAAELQRNRRAVHGDA